MKTIVRHAQKLVYIFLYLMPSTYPKTSLQAIVELLLEAQDERRLAPGSKHLRSCKLIPQQSILSFFPSHTKLRRTQVSCLIAFGQPRFIGELVEDKDRHAK
jgi:hypothetical protein